MSSEHKQDKGMKGGNCNRTACQKPGAEWFNHSTRSYYCGECAEEINRVNPEALAMYGHELCTREQPQEGNPLTAEEAREKACAASAQDKRLFYTDVKSYMLGFYAGYDHVSNQTAALREELEAVKKERDLMKEERNRALNEFASLQFSSVQGERRHLKELEAVKKERDAARTEVGLLRRDVFSGIRDTGDIHTKLAEVTRQRDEFANLLRQIPENEPWPDFYDEIQKALSRLSSGETKAPPEAGHFQANDQGEQVFVTTSANYPVTPVSQWISVDDRLPEQGQTVAFVVDLPGQYRHGQVYGGKFTGSDFATPGCGQPASHWMPLPAPPESLTDKDTTNE